MNRPLRVGIAGLGNVGCGVVKILQQYPDMIASRAGRPVEIICVSARDAHKDRGIDISAYEWLDSPERMAGDPRLDVVIELMGGAEGTARNLVERCLKAGKPVITANKALLAEHGFELAAMADSSAVSLFYEAAVAGGIPIIKTLREGFAGNEIKAIYGILNGTCNYILTEMRETGRAFDDVLKEAQQKGYAEADPSFDVDGIDAAHKLSILAALAFGVKPDFSKADILGIRHITADDIACVTELGYRIKLLGMARRVGDGRIVQRMEPCLVPKHSPIGAVDGVYNAVLIDGNFVGTSLLIGRGAGGGPTSSAVLSDIVDMARNLDQAKAGRPVYGIPALELENAVWGGPEDVLAHFYMRLSVLDKPGVLAEVTAILRDHKISVESVIQRGRSPDQPVSIILTTHESRQADVMAACRGIADLDLVRSEPTVMPIVQF